MFFIQETVNSEFESLLLDDKLPESSVDQMRIILRDDASFFSGLKYLTLQAEARQQMILTPYLNSEDLPRNLSFLAQALTELGSKPTIDWLVLGDFGSRFFSYLAGLKEHELSIAMSNQQNCDIIIEESFKVILYNYLSAEQRVKSLLEFVPRLQLEKSQIQEDQESKLRQTLLPYKDRTAQKTIKIKIDQQLADEMYDELFATQVNTELFSPHAVAVLNEHQHWFLKIANALVLAEI